MTDISRLPGAFVHEWDWQQHAACRGLDVSLFFHPSGERGRSHDEREARAKQVCAGCPVRLECASYALSTHEPYGVWGGLTEDERHALVAANRERERARSASRA